MTTQTKIGKAQAALKPLTLQSQIIQTALTPLAACISKIIAITNQKGGVGKTSTSFNFAHYVNELGYRVLVVDLDGQGNLTELFFEVDVLERFVHTPAIALFQQGTAENFHPLAHPSGIDLLPTRPNSHEMNNVDTMDIQVAGVFYDNLKVIAQNYDFVLCDTPPTPGVRTTAACGSADYIFAPVLVDTFANSALAGVISSVENIGRIIEADLSLTGILINQLQDSTEETKQDYKKLSTRIGGALIPTPIRFSKPFARAQKQGVPVWHLNRSGSERNTSRETRQAYGEMAARIPEIQIERIEHFSEVSRAVRNKIANESASV
ncbi:ParA family protein [Pseudomonas sp. MWU12-2323]|uniref:ParA family protein n=1 Tax=Pseudomonas sp. MWU12-2323 TaxID=2651296 RepID=UPI00128C7E0C|nr:ParA family protein [Pseudomonas sp. MWU12-2323]MPQ69273.1 AAA family ATPase [Pseudomonas sp. MWU12-2323]